MYTRMVTDNWNKLVMCGVCGVCGYVVWCVWCVWCGCVVYVVWCVWCVVKMCAVEPTRGLASLTNHTNIGTGYCTAAKL